MTFRQFVLLKLVEECAEVQKRATKSMQFGADEIEPNGTKDNAARLRLEINDLLAHIQLYEDTAGEWRSFEALGTVKGHIEDKLHRVENFLKLSIARGEVKR